MGRLRRDQGGNTLAMMAAFLLPLCALAGSAIDMARLYVVKVRLQQACDAGALAGRKFMTSSSLPTLDATATTQAKTFFANNFPSGFMGTAAFTSTTNPYPFVPTKTSDQQVAGTATATVPMTIMKMFNYGDKPLTVTCEARFDVADTDIMFVLDTTGSMACKPEDSDTTCSNTMADAVTYTRPSTNTNGVAGYAGSQGYRVPEKTNSGGANVSRIQALRTAVIDFYNTIKANVDSSTHVRYGFVTYSSMVNAGQAIMEMNPSYIVGGSGSGNWTYQSRIVNGDYVISNGAYADISPNKNSTDCTNTATVRTPGTPRTYASNGTATQTEYRYNTTTNKCQMRTNSVGPQWKYQPQLWPVGAYVGGAQIADPTSVNGGKTRWVGCIEERDTTSGTKTFDSDNLPSDLNPDLTPFNDATRWRPYWPDVEYVRPTYNVYPTSNGESSDYESYMDPDRLVLGKNGCAKPVQRLKELATVADVSAFVNAPDFVPLGGTYHDIGMIWGVRMLSPNGIFGADTAAWPGRQQPKRIIVFMTDGAMSPSADAYSVYGVEQLDRRVTNGDYSTPEKRAVYHNARFLAECDKAKSMNIDVWTIAIAPDEDDNLTACATVKGQAFFTTSGTGLSDAFKAIAKQVAMLRISK